MTEIAITSALKFGLVDWGKNKDNIEMLLNLLSDELTQYSGIQPNDTV